jgi:ribonuclease BN (tRNA processing enzyme)
MTQDDPLNPHDALQPALLDALTSGPARVLLAGPSGAGKSTILSALAAHAPPRTRLLCADPGRPLVGPPGALSLARLEQGAWVLEHTEALCSVDSLRYRLPLLALALRLARLAPEGAPLLVDVPGVSRGQSARELLSTLPGALAITHAFALGAGKRADAVHDALARATPWLARFASHPAAKPLSDSKRDAARTTSWGAFLGEAPARETFALPLVGAPPPTRQAEDWVGRQVAPLDDAGRTLGLGHVVARGEGGELELEWARTREGDPRALLVRDARVTRGAPRTSRRESAQRELLRSHGAAPATAFTHRAKPDYRVHITQTHGPRSSAIRPTFVGGLFEDPMVALRLDHQQRCLLLDLGEVRQVPTKIIHQVTDLLVSHAHLDHVGDFPWLLRRLVGIERPLRLYGPPGITERVAHLVFSYTWDRIGERGPRFEVHELDGEVARRAIVRAGADGVEPLEPLDAPGGLLRDEPGLRLQAVELDHGGTPVLAFSIEETDVHSVRGNVLRERGWAPGGWLGQLKKRAAQRELDGTLAVELAAGGELDVPVAELADALLIPTPGQKIVYATDFADSPANRDAVVALARGAHLLVCEASFASQDAEQAARTGHMTARACAEIARDAGVKLLVPFHLSVRYESQPELVYSEILEVFEHTYVPAGVLARMERE